jgi:hypothetical protein
MWKTLSWEVQPPEPEDRESRQMSPGKVDLILKIAEIREMHWADVFGKGGLGVGLEGWE